MFSCIFRDGLPEALPPDDEVQLSDCQKLGYSSLCSLLAPTLLQSACLASLGLRLEIQSVVSQTIEFCRLYMRHLQLLIAGLLVSELLSECVLE